ncbi:protein DELAY OF GERMINATION 1-like [Impatiens glandulifera]|uniref:protein DELAY OF GERMINATION 1-like n=1 Tax=Impatiens glandulifera TaxID=253017 RepID=UPI001FB0D982|nr:protein DELAY OF GERMINATION 1-like [Impatiens glandulifera]
MESSSGINIDDDTGNLTGGGDHGRFKYCYANWMAQQEDDLELLFRTLSSDSDPHNNDANLMAAVESVLGHLQDYLDNRGSQSARCESPCLFLPSWCTDFEKSIHWMGGCRATMCIRLVYALSGLESEAEAPVMEYLRLRGGRRENLGKISDHQFNLIKTLQIKTIMEEDKLSAQMAILQGRIEDERLSRIGNCSREMGDSRAVEKLLKDANKLKMDTIKELLTNILTPIQAVDMLVASKKLHLFLPQWDKTRDQILNAPNP